MQTVELLEFIVINMIVLSDSFTHRQVQLNLNEFNKVLIVEHNTSEYLILSTKNSIIKLSLLDMKVAKRSIGPIDHSVYCSEPDKCMFSLCNEDPSQTLSCSKRSTDVYVKSWTSHNNLLFVCFNVYHGYCETLDINNFDGKSIGHSYSIVSSDLTSHSTMLYINKKIYFGIEINRKSIFLGIDLFTFSIRRIPNFKTVASDTDILYGSYGKLDFGAQAIYPLKFKGSFSLKDKRSNGYKTREYVFFLLNQPENKLDPINGKYQTRLVRICEEDYDFSSFMDIVLTCGNLDSQYYLEINSWHFGKVGSELSEWYKKTTRFESLKKEKDADFENVLFVIYKIQRITTDYAETQNQLLMCSYPIAEIMELYDVIRRNCNNEKGSINLKPYNKYSTEEPCEKDPNTFQSETEKGHCGGLKAVNKFIIGHQYDSEMFKNNVVLKMPDTRGDAIKILSVNNRYTVAAIGGSNGNLYEVDIYESNSKILTNRKIFNSSVMDLVVSKNNTLYAMSKTKLMAVDLVDCQTNKCSDCIHLSPFCGWCVGSGQCTTKLKCVNNWIEYSRNFSNTRCPKIVNLNHSNFDNHIGKNPVTEFQIQNFNSDPRDISCIYKNGAEILYKSKATINGSRLSCLAPKATDISKLHFEKDLLKMNFAVYIDAILLSQTQFSIFDCKKNQNCKECTNSNFDCSWSISLGTCLSSVNSKNSSISFVLHNQAYNCPKLTLLKTSYPVQSNIIIKVKIVKLNLNLNQNVFFYCKDKCTNKSVRGHLTDDVIECNIGRINYHSLANKSCSLKISWNTSASPNTNHAIGFTYEVYDCRKLVKYCDDCILLANNYECGYCKGSEQCTAREACRTNDWINSIDKSCPNPEILEIKPQNSTISSESIISVKGVNLGFREENIANSVFLENNRIVFNCSYIRGSFVKSKQFKCQIKKRKVHIATPVAFQFVLYSKLIKIKREFWFFDPMITTIKPNFGPLIGGTVIYITGKYLNVGSSRIIYFTLNNGVVNCHIKSNTETLITCTMADFHRSLAGARRKRSIPLNKGMLTLKIDNFVREYPNIAFSFYKTPKRFKMMMNKFLYSGGQILEIQSENMNIINRPCSTVICSHSSTNCKDCYSVVTNKTLCVLPRVKEMDKESYCEIKFGMEKGHVYLYNSSALFFPLPIFKNYTYEKKLPPKEISFSKKKEKINDVTLKISYNGSSHFSLFKTDINITVGSANCKIQHIMPNQLHCSISVNKVKTDFRYDAILKIGNSTTMKIGYVLFIAGGITLDTQTIIIILIIVLVPLIIIIISSVVIVKKTRSKHKKNKRNDILQLEKYHTDVDGMIRKGLLQVNETPFINDDLIKNFNEVPLYPFNVYILYNLFPNFHPRMMSEQTNNPNKKAKSVFDLKGFEYREFVPESHPLLFTNKIQVIEDTVEYSRKLSKLFDNTLFVFTFFSFLDDEKDIVDSKKAEIVSLLSVILMRNMSEYLKILQILIKNKYHERHESEDGSDIFRQTSLLPRFLTNWLIILMYEELTLSNAAGNLLRLYLRVLKVINEGPVESKSNKSYYSLSDVTLLKEQIDFKSITVTVVYNEEQFFQPVDREHRDDEKSINVTLLDCDTIQQAKIKILEEIYKYYPYSRWCKSVDLILYEEIDDREYLIKDKGFLMNKGIVNDSVLRIVVNDPKSTLNHTTTASCSNANSLSGSRLNNNVIEDIHNTDKVQKKSSKLCFKSKQKNEIKSVIKNAYLINALIMEKKLNESITNLFNEIISQECQFIGDLFSYFDNICNNEATQLNWKSTCLILRFWVNLITNIDFLFDIPLSEHKPVNDNMLYVGKILCNIFFPNDPNDFLSGLCKKMIKEYRPKAIAYYDNIRNIFSRDGQTQYNIPNINGINISLAIVILYHNFMHPRKDNFINYIKNSNNPISEKTAWIEVLQEVYSLYTPESFLLVNDNE